MDSTLTNKFVAVLNEKIPIGALMNALAHMSVGLTAAYPDQSQMRFDQYIDASGSVHHSISDHPFIILTAENSNQIRKLRDAAKEAQLVFTDFTSTMTVGSYLEQKERTKMTIEAELEYYGICMFGQQSILNSLTKKFSLWR